MELVCTNLQSCNGRERVLKSCSAASKQQDDWTTACLLHSAAGALGGTFLIYVSQGGRTHFPGWALLESARRSRTANQPCAAQDANFLTSKKLLRPIIVSQSYYSCSTRRN